MAQFSAFLRQLSPLLLGTQVGQVLGTLAQRVLGQYDIAVPRSGPGQLLFVVPNLAAFERDWSLDPREFRTFVALHEVLHGLGFDPDDARRRALDGLSGGERGRLGLVRQLVAPADLLLLDADPLKDITNTRRIAGVMLGERWMARADLDAMLAEPVP